MSYIREDKSEFLQYDNPEFQVFFRKNYIPATFKLDEIFIHWHDEVEFLYVVEGSVGYRLNGSYVKMNAGEGIFVNSRQLHVIASENVDCVLYCLIFHPMILSSSNCIAATYVNTIINNDSIPHMFLSEEIPWQKKILHSIKNIENYEKSSDFCDENYVEPIGHELSTMKEIYDIWYTLYLNLGIEKSGKVSQNHDLYTVKQMIGFIQDNYKEKLVLDDICNIGSVGKTKCTALFDSYTNMTPMEYVKSYRIDKSTAMLTQTDMSVTEIAGEVGFMDGSYFTKAFRSYLGMTPLEYRKCMRNKK